MPRPYTLGKREQPKAETRARIVAAASRIYLEQGLRAASTLAIARAADVAPGTVRNHFPTQREMSAAVLDEVLSAMGPPTPDIYDGVADLAARIRRLSEALAAFYERTEPWWRAYEREPELIDAWSGGVERYYRDLESLMRGALDDLADDETAVAVVAAVIGPPTFFALRARGISSTEAVDLGVSLAVPWLEGRRRSRRSRRG